jgi:hypothetical protein
VLATPMPDRALISAPRSRETRPQSRRSAGFTPTVAGSTADENVWIEDLGDMTVGSSRRREEAVGSLRPASHDHGTGRRPSPADGQDSFSPVRIR